MESNTSSVTSWTVGCPPSEAAFHAKLAPCRAMAGSPESGSGSGGGCAISGNCAPVTNAGQPCKLNRQCCIAHTFILMVLRRDKSMIGLRCALCLQGMHGQPWVRRPDSSAIKGRITAVTNTPTRPLHRGCSHDERRQVCVGHWRQTQGGDKDTRRCAPRQTPAGASARRRC